MNNSDTKDGQEKLMRERIELETEEIIFRMGGLFSRSGLFYRNYITWENLIKEKYGINPVVYLERIHKELRKKYRVVNTSSEKINEA